MEDVGECPELLLELVKAGCIEVEERLQRDPLLPLAVECLIDDPHPALTEATKDLVSIGALPGRRFTQRTSTRRRRLVLDHERRLFPVSRARCGSGHTREDTARSRLTLPQRSRAAVVS